MFLKVLRNSLTILLGNGFSKLMLLACEFYLAIHIGAGSYGLFSITLSVLLVVGNLCLIGLNFGIIQYLAIYQEQKDEEKIVGLIQWSLIIVSLVGLSAGAILYFLAQPLSAKVFHKAGLLGPLRTLAIVLPLEALNQCLGSIFRGLRRFQCHILVSDLIRNALLALSVFLVMENPSVEQLVTILLVGNIFGFLFGILKINSLHPFLRKLVRDRSLVSSLFHFSYLLFLWNVFQTLMSRIQVILAGMFLPSQEVGVFSILLRFMLMFTALRTALNFPTSVEFAKLHYTKDFSLLKRLFENVSQTLMVVSTLAAIPFLVSPELILRFTGKEYIPYAWLLPYLIYAQVFNNGAGPAGQLLVSCHQQPTVLALSMIGGILQITLCSLLMTHLGLRGGVYAVTITTIAMEVMRQIASYKLLSIHFLKLRFAILNGMALISWQLGGNVASLFRGLPRFLLANGTAYAAMFLLSSAYFALDKQLRRETIDFLKRVVPMRVHPNKPREG